MKKLLLAFAACAASVCGFAANHNVDDLSTLPTTFSFFEGDTVTLPVGPTYKVLGDAIAIVDGNVITCKKSGFTLVNDGATDYRMIVFPHPLAGGDVFYYLNTNGNGENWSKVSWTKVTQNTDRTYPNDANDIAVVEASVTYAKMYVDVALSLHGYVLGLDNQWGQLATVNGQTLTFCGADDDPAFFRLSCAKADKCQVRLGAENKTDDNNTLKINIAATTRML